MHIVLKAEALSNAFTTTIGGFVPFYKGFFYSGLICGAKLYNWHFFVYFGTANVPIN
jgi:hypothetical protein